MKMFQILKIVGLFVGAALILSSAGCSATPHQTGKKITVRLTTYSRNEKLPKKHPDKWSWRGISSTGIPLKNMESVAVDPRVIPYFSRIKLPGLDHLLTSVDTGSWVVSRRAALKCGLNVPVIDLFFDRERDAAEFRKKNPLFVEAVIF